MDCVQSVSATGSRFLNAPHGGFDTHNWLEWQANIDTNRSNQFRIWYLKKKPNQMLTFVSLQHWVFGVVPPSFSSKFWNEDILNIPGESSKKRAFSDFRSIV